MIEPKEITPEIIKKHGITESEYKSIVDILGRAPNFTELGIFSVMWSEHCSYKNSRRELKKFPTKGCCILVKAGEENAGVVDIGDGLAISFKVESHNHPSAVEPFQGAATGVGGIIRDIFTMGARPILVMNSLRFGDIKKKRVQYLLKGVVGGIAHYGNCIGLPTVGGEVYFDSSYEGNPLVNAMCLGVLRTDSIKYGQAKGSGNPVFYVGSATGRDGLAGASFASRELTQQSCEDRPAVQVGDPFMEKLLMEACLELYKTDYVVGIQDMGAAGLTCSTCETASRANMGIEIEINKVPMRETGMIPYEVMLSESQERMLVILKKGKEKDVQKIFEKWDLHAVKIGEVTSDGMMRVKFNGKTVAEIPARKLANDAPLYAPLAKKPEYLAQLNKPYKVPKLKTQEEFQNVLIKLLEQPTISNKEWIYEQYDHMVRTNTLVYPGSDSAVVRLKGTKKALAMSTDCNSTYCLLDPYKGSEIAVCESARNVAVSGARPLAVTDCLNFGNPNKPGIFWQFKESIRGISDACNILGTPVTGGNVSFYNENPEGAVDPTPVIGVVGLIDDVEKNFLPVSSYFKRENDAIILLGKNKEEFGGSEYLKVNGLGKRGPCPDIDVRKEKRLIDLMVEGAGLGFFQSAHDVSEGGLGVCLAESCIIKKGNELGAIVDISEILKRDDVSKEALLFGETQTRVVVSALEYNVDKIFKLAKKYKIECAVMGFVKKDNFSVTCGKTPLFSLPVKKLASSWRKLTRTLSV